MRRGRKVLIWVGGIQVVLSLFVRGLDWIGRYDLAKDLSQRWTVPAMLAFLLSVPGQLLVFAAGTVLIFTGLMSRPQQHMPPTTRRSTDRSPVQRDEAKLEPGCTGVTPDRVEVIADAMLEALRAADGQPVYLTAFDGRGAQLEVDEAVSRLRRRSFVEVLGGYPDPVVLYLTANGRRHVLQR